jgi:hypothetical protein
MKPKIYIIGTLILYLFVVFGSIFIRDLGMIFEIIAAISLTVINFIWPGSFYLIAEHKYGRKKRN